MICDICFLYVFINVFFYVFIKTLYTIHVFYCNGKANVQRNVHEHDAWKKQNDFLLVSQLRYLNVGTQKNSLTEPVLLCTQKICLD